MSDDTTVNNEKQPGGVTGKGFKKGDPRINRLGRPKSFDAFRKLLQDIASEPAVDAAGQPIMRNGRPATNAEMFAEAWMKDRKQRRDFAAFTWGKPKEEISLEHKGEIVLKKKVGVDLDKV